jgi:hypothetical protein
MTRLFFLPRMSIYIVIAFYTYAFFKLTFLETFFVTLLGLIATYPFRRPKVPYQETVKTDGEIYLSPVFGTIESIRFNVPGPEDIPMHEVRISTSILEPKGIYLPTNAEMSYLKANKGVGVKTKAPIEQFTVSLESIAHTNLTIQSKNNCKTHLRFVDRPKSMRPTIWLKSGDKGRGAACFGYYPLGGTLLIYLPNNSDILVFEKEQMRPGESVIARLKD